MIKSLVKTKVQQFKAAAGSFWGQKDAERIWKEVTWKLGLKPGELYALSEGWAQCCLNSDTGKLEVACDQILARLK